MSQEIIDDKFTLDINIQDPNWGSIINKETTEKVKKLTKYLIGLSGVEKDFTYEISLLLCNNSTIQNLNEVYRGKNKATNVLSFPIYELFINGYYDLYVDDIISLGDIIISYEYSKSEAIALNKPFQDHFFHLYAHGLLHLFGYDHENDKDAEIMESKEIEALAQLGINSPYDTRI